jgi:hypothetical protein
MYTLDIETSRELTVSFYKNWLSRRPTNPTKEGKV